MIQNFLFRLFSYGLADIMPPERFEALDQFDYQDYYLSSCTEANYGSYPKDRI